MILVPPFAIEAKDGAPTMNVVPALKGETWGTRRRFLDAAALRSEWE